MLRHDPRSKRIQGEREVHVFEAPVSSRPALSTRSIGVHDAGTLGIATNGNKTAEKVAAEQFNAFLQEEERIDDDMQWLDEREIQYME